MIRLSFNKIAVFASGSGSNLQALIDAGEQETTGFKVALVVSNKENAYAMERADSAGVTKFFYQKNTEDLLAELEKNAITFIVLAGYLAKVPEVITRKYAQRIINIHPSLIPKYCGKGFYGIHVHEAVLAAGESTTGVTVHYVDEHLDTGEIIEQVAVPVLATDTPEKLQQRVLEIEHKVLVEVTQNLVEKLKGEK